MADLQVGISRREALRREANQLDKRRVQEELAKLDEWKEFAPKLEAIIREILGPEARTTVSTEVVTSHVRYAESLGRVSPQVDILASQALVRYADEFARATPPSYLSMHSLDEIVRALRKLRTTPEKKVDEFSTILAKMRGSRSGDEY